MTTYTPIDPAGLVAEVSDLNDQAAQAMRVAATHKAKADGAQATARAESAAATLADRDAHISISGIFTRKMRALTSEVRDARAAAIDAVRAGGDVLGTWVEYRKVRARNKATWEALGYDYVRAVRREQPPGDWGDPLHAIHGNTEPFEQFIMVAMLEVEGEVAESTAADIRGALDAAHEATRAAKQGA